MGAQRQPVPACGPLLRQTSVSEHPGAQQRSHTHPNLKHLNDQRAFLGGPCVHMCSKSCRGKAGGPVPLPTSQPEVCEVLAFLLGKASPAGTQARPEGGVVGAKAVTTCWPLKPRSPSISPTPPEPRAPGQDITTPGHTHNFPDNSAPSSRPACPVARPSGTGHL